MKSVRRAGVFAIGLALILISASLGVGWLALAAHAWLTTLVGAALASLIVAGTLVLPFLILIFVHVISSAAERKAQLIAAEQHARLERERPREMAGHVTDQIQHLFRERPLLSRVMTLAAGAVIARYPGAAAGMVKLLGRAAR